jgi:predicted PhzF superfamily epimerase YddE/YHI9
MKIFQKVRIFRGDFNCELVVGGTKFTVSSACYKAMDYMVIFNDEKDIESIKPDFSKLKGVPLRGVIVTAKSKKYDFVSRFFAPNVGVDEDPVTGSSFTQLVPYWAKELGKDIFHAKQISKRGGEVYCKLNGNRVKISGYCVTYMLGSIEI